MGAPNHRLLLCEEKSHGVEKELYDLFIEMNSVGANNQDTWGKLFKTLGANSLRLRHTTSLKLKWPSIKRKFAKSLRLIFRNLSRTHTS